MSPWPSYETPPAVAFIDVDGTLLAETTTYLFARILRRRGLIKRSFILRALYHGLQHRFGRLDYGRLVAFGLNSIARIPIVDLQRIAYENFDEYVKPRLYEGVVEHLNDLRSEGTAVVLVSSSPGIVLEPLSDLPRLHRHDHDAGPNRARASGRNRRRAAMLRRREVVLGAAMGGVSANRDGRSGGLCG